MALMHWNDKFKVCMILQAAVGNRKQQMRMETSFLVKEKSYKYYAFWQSVPVFTHFVAWKIKCV